MKKNNIVVSSYDSLLQEKQETELLYQKLQRQRDLQLDTINKKYGIKIERALRRSEFLSMQIDQAKKYLGKN